MSNVHHLGCISALLVAATSFACGAGGTGGEAQGRLRGRAFDFAAIDQDSSLLHIRTQCEAPRADLLTLGYDDGALEIAVTIEAGLGLFRKSWELGPEADPDVIELKIIVDGQALGLSEGKLETDFDVANGYSGTVTLATDPGDSLEATFEYLFAEDDENAAECDADDSDADF